MPFQPPYPPWDPTDTECFAYETVIKRWPIIITGVIDVLHKTCHDLTVEIQALGENVDPTSKKEALQKKIAEGTRVIEKVSKLKYEMARDRPLDKIVEDGEPGVEGYNTELEALEKDNRNTWFTAPWLFAECYLYRLLRSYICQTTSWKSFDPFYEQKVRTFQHSGKSIFQIATTMHELGKGGGEDVDSDSEKLKVLFMEMIQMCLWGNATDLSLLTHLSQDDIQNLQTVGKDAQSERSKFILKDDQEAVWQHLKTLKAGTVDFVLDNSGFELFTDLVFADFLVTHTPYVSKVVFHPKLIPWFVSDVTPPDFKDTFDLLSDPNFFPQEELSAAHTSGGFGHLQEMLSRWSKHLENGLFSLSVPVETPLGGGSAPSSSGLFWTMPRPYWDMETEGSKTFKLLKDSGLVIFKGDLNYRKLTGDIRWPAWTTFHEAVGPLAGRFPILSLRTNKADVVVGVDRSVAENLDTEEKKKWRVDGRYALISFLPKSVTP